MISSPRMAMLTVFAAKPYSFIFGFVAHAACLAIGVKLLREGQREGA